MTWPERMERGLPGFSRFWTENLDSGERDPVLLDPLVERAARNPESVRGSIDPPALLGQGELDQPPLRIVQGQPGKGIEAARALEVETHVLRFQNPSGRLQRRPLEHVTELADVSGPGVRLQS